MNKDEIIQMFQTQKTVLSFPDRGPWGDNKYNGSWSGYIPMFFWNLLGATSTAEAFAGGGTTSDAAKFWNIPYVGVDLNPNPVRPDIISMDLTDLSVDLPDAFRTADVVLSHPPYPGINYVRYANKMYKDPDGTLSVRDIQNMSYEDGIRKIDMVNGRLMSAMAPGAFLVVCVGEIRNSQVGYKSMYKDMTVYGTLWQTFIKMQHNTKSDLFNKNYSASKRALTAHEMILVMRKPSGYEFAMVIPKQVKIDLRNSQMSSWKDLVMVYAREKKEFTNQEMYEDFRPTIKAKNNPNVEAKLRQTCQQLEKNNLLIHIGTGKWALAA